MKIWVVFSLAIVSASASPILGRIFQGNDANPGEFPYQVGMRIARDNAQYWCGGVMISEIWVLTAAHCLDGADLFTLLLGATDTTKPERTFTLIAGDVIIHENWDSYTMSNDIALIKVPNPGYSDRISPVTLPRVESTDYNNYDHEYALATGWGLMGDVGDHAEHLQVSYLPIVHNDVCALFFPEDDINGAKICVATWSGGSPCLGDSGGPLVHVESNVLIGISSSIPLEGCQRGMPAVYTRVTYHRQWIRNNSGV